MLLHLGDVLLGEPIHPSLLATHLPILHLLAKSHTLGVDAHIVQRLVSRAHDALRNPGRVAAVLRVGDDLLVVGGPRHCGTMVQVAAESVVGPSDGEMQFGHVALEGIEVLAESGVELVEAHQDLA